MKVEFKKTLWTVNSVQLHSLPSKSREPGRLTEELAIFPERAEDASSRGFEKPDGSRSDWKLYFNQLWAS